MDILDIDLAILITLSQALIIGLLIRMDCRTHGVADAIKDLEETIGKEIHITRKSMIRDDWREHYKHEERE